MARREKFDIIKIHTKNVSLIWKNVRGIAPDVTSLKTEAAMLDWLYELTEALQIWIDKGLHMTDGELILARINLGAVVESWLRLFYCTYYDEYILNPRKNKKGKIIEPESGLRFEDLKKYSIGILWDDETEPEYIWVNEVQHKRNAVHSFQYRDIGTPRDFLNDIERFYDFVQNIVFRLPNVEDSLESYPPGYVTNVYYE
ncbi:MAG: hypothetical protein Q4B70_18595 [Lachnospiraceae bacterium]|nr:hypothetical protein [Lachnospiraceae bacterium]